jgi:hypothetical protein
MPVRRRPTAPQFVALSDLVNQPYTTRDFISLLPALLISFALNAALIGGMAWFMSGDAAARSGVKTRTVEGDELAQKQKDEKDPKKDQPPIDIDLMKGMDQKEDVAKPIEPGPPTPAKELDPVLPKGIEEPKKEDDPIGAGPFKDEAGMLGDRKDTPAAPGLPGRMLDADPGRPGTEGSGPMGKGSGLEGGGKHNGGGFGYRVGNLDAIARSRGGNDASQRAVAMGLTWLKKHQGRDGRWSLDRYHQAAAGCNCRLPYENGVKQDDMAATALGLLPFLGAGHSHKRDTEFKETVFNGLSYMLSHQDGSGKIGTDMYAHGLGTIALCEAYGLTRDENIRIAAQRAVEYILRAQHKNPGAHHGGWRYEPRFQTSDVSVTGWQVMALKSAQMADLNVPPQSLRDAQKFLDNCWVKAIQNDKDPKSPMQGYAYLPGGGPTQTMTAVALLNRQYYGWGPLNRDLLAGCDYLLTDPPPLELGPRDEFKIYYWYYATQVMHHLGGEHFEKWNPRIRDLLVNTQEKAGHKAGSWDPSNDPWARHGGRLYVTSLSVLTLEVYYRFLPLYRRENVATSAPPAPANANKPPEKKGTDKK